MSKQDERKESKAEPVPNPLSRPLDPLMTFSEFVATSGHSPILLAGLKSQCVLRGEVMKRTRKQWEEAVADFRKQPVPS